jgi:CBS domain-containing protein
MEVQDVMTRKVVTVGQDTPYKEAVELLLAEDVSGMPVIDEFGWVVGIVSEADLISKEAYPEPTHRRFRGLIAHSSESWSAKAAGLRVGDVMSQDVIIAGPNEDVRTVARRMLEKKVKRMPVVTRSGRLVGIVSRHDLLRAFHVTDEELSRWVCGVLERNLFVAPDHDVVVSANEGVVRLTGTVLRESDIEIAASIARTVEGVVGVVTDLAFRERDAKYRRIEVSVS